MPLNGPAPVHPTMYGQSPNLVQTNLMIQNVDKTVPLSARGGDNAEIPDDVNSARDPTMDPGMAPVAPYQYQNMLPAPAMN